ncbi:acyl carrier protein [Plantactinospora sp. KBS50]|uniref:acyl carrier protein n=1 Tax=Plantactinospora sp. KBS50 TaxID=2024580 RepID=UPI000BAAFFEA|nr:phosphopantetheine-binding protein [Plantactinospora sp. KBS50]ASW55616.1 hypothetical protein CIK06_17665 [Plantactinospora sp. KBS50]
MSSELEGLVRERVAQVLADVPAGELELDADLADDYGLTSLNKVLLVTSLCDDAGVDVANFTEFDVAAMRTVAQLRDALAKHQPATT